MMSYGPPNILCAQATSGSDLNSSTITSSYPGSHFNKTNANDISQKNDLFLSVLYYYAVMRSVTGRQLACALFSIPYLFTLVDLRSFFVHTNKQKKRKRCCLFIALLTP